MLDILYILFGILGSIGGILWLWEQIRKWFYHRAFEQIFGSLRNERPIVVCPSQPGIDLSPNISTTYEDSMAQAALQSQFAARGILHEVRLHNQLQKEDRPKHLFLICGPSGNSITSEFMAHPSVGLPFRFQKTDHGWVILNSDGEPSHPLPTPRETDFGIVARLSNPWSRPEKPTFVYIAAGLSGLGTWGAAYYLASRVDDLHRRLSAERAASNCRFIGVIKSKSSGYHLPLTVLQELKVL